MEFHERLVYLRDKKGLTQKELAKEIVVSREALSLWEIGKRFPKDRTIIEKLAESLGVSIGFLLTGKDGKKIKSVPVYGIIRAGEPITAVQNIIEWVEIPNEWANGDAEHFFLRIQGDSMEGARIRDGDYIFVRHQDWAENGDIIVAIINMEDATVKRIFFADDTIILHPENTKYKPMIFKDKERENIKIIGKVLWFKGTV